MVTTARRTLPSRWGENPRCTAARIAAKPFSGTCTLWALLPPPWPPPWASCTHTIPAAVASQLAVRERRSRRMAHGRCASATRAAIKIALDRQRDVGATQQSPDRRGSEVASRPEDGPKPWPSGGTRADGAPAVAHRRTVRDSPCPRPCCPFFRLPRAQHRPLPVRRFESARQLNTTLGSYSLLQSMDVQWEVPCFESNHL